MDVLKNRNSLLILLGNGLSFFGLGMNFIALSWLILDMTNDVLYVSILVALQSVPGIITSPIAGVLIDRYDKRKLIIISDISRCILVLMIPILHITGILNVWYLFVITLLMTVLGSLFFPSLSGVIKSAIPENLLLKTFSANATATQLGMVFGGIVSGVIIANFSIFNIFLIDALTYLLSGICFFYLRYKSNIVLKKNDNDINKIKSYYVQIKEAIIYITNNNEIVFLIILSLVPGIITSLVNSLLAAYTKDTLKLGAEAYGYLEASFAVGSIIIGLSIVSTIKGKLTEYSLLNIGLFILSISMLLLGLSRGLELSLISMFIAGASIMLITPSRKTLLIKNLDESFIGRVESLNFMLFSSVGPIITIIIGWLSGYTGHSSVFYGLSFCILLVSFISLNLSKKFAQSKQHEVSTGL